MFLEGTLQNILNVKVDQINGRIFFYNFNIKPEIYPNIFEQWNSKMYDMFLSLKED